MFAMTALFAGGCVERTITITSSPPGSLVYLNDQEIGRTPVTRDFTWYGNYQVTLRKEGYQTLKTTQMVAAPIYQIVPIDLFAEVLPFHLHDQQQFSFNLLPTVPTDPQGLLDRAEDMKSQLQPSERTTTQPSKASAKKSGPSTQPGSR
jgi:hypothetical protein